LIINKIIEQNELQYHFLSPLFNYFILISAQRLYFFVCTHFYETIWNESVINQEVFR